jgi:outer membrane protein assembly factor BamB
MSQLSIRKGFAPFLPLLLIALGSLSLCAQTLTLSLRSGPPTTRITVDGTGFTPTTAITVAFGRAVAPVVSDGSGAFQTQIQVPASAQPGLHRVMAKSGTTVLAKTSFLVRTNWPQFGFVPAGGRWNRYENTLSVSTAPTMVVRWSARGTSSPAVANGAVYVASWQINLQGSLNDALKASTGALLWSVVTGYVHGPPAVGNGLVYVASEDNNVYALNTSTGATQWSFATGGLVDSSPAVANGVVYVGSYDDTFYALNASTGTLLWSFATGGYIAQGPAVVNGVVYVSSMDRNSYGLVYALNANTGAHCGASPPGAGRPRRRWRTEWCTWARMTTMYTP